MLSLRVQCALVVVHHPSTFTSMMARDVRNFVVRSASCCLVPTRIGPVKRKHNTSVLTAHVHYLFGKHERKLPSTNVQTISVRVGCRPSNDSMTEKRNYAKPSLLNSSFVISTENTTSNNSNLLTHRLPSQKFTSTASILPTML